MRWLTRLFVWGGVAFVGVVALAAVAGSQVLPPGTDGPADGCAGQVPIVVGSDRSAQSDLYSAVTLAGVIDTSCIVLAGPRDGEMPADQIARLDAALADPSIGGWVMGGEAAVPEAKVAGRGLKRLNGVDRWHTARLAGAIALDPDGDVAALTVATAPGEGELDGGSVTVDGAEVRLPPGLDASCAGQVPIVVAVDAAAQSDLYSAATLAGVLDTTCYVLAGARGEPMAAEQQARLAAADGARPGAADGANGGVSPETSTATGGWIVGGIAAVPDAKVAGFTLTRIGGADRWETARLIGEAAVAQAARNAAAAAASTTTTEARSGGGSSSGGGGGSARSSGGGGSSRRVSSGGGGGVSRPPTGTPTGGTPTGTPSGGTTTTTSTTSTSTTTTTTMPVDAGGGAPAMASMFAPSVSVRVPRLDGTMGDNIWATSEFEVSIARASGADDECSLMSSQTVTFTVQADGSVTDDGSVPTDLTGSTAAGVMCSYTVTFPAPPTDSPGGDFDWTMAAPTQTQVTLTESSRTATGAYTVGDVTFVPDATITVPSGSDGLAFDVSFASAQANCSGSDGSPQTLTFTVPAGGTSAEPNATNTRLIAYPAGAASSTDVCSYTVTFSPNENDGTSLELVPGSDSEVSGTSQVIAAMYAPPLSAGSFRPSLSVSVPQLGGATGANIWAGATFEVGVARASGAHDGCSLSVSVVVTFTVQGDGSVTSGVSELPDELIGTLADQTAKCTYTVTFPAAPTDTSGGEFDWSMSPAAATMATLSDVSVADQSATGAYTVGDVTFAPDASITVPSGSDGLAFDVGFAGSRAACSGNPAVATLSYAVPAGGTSAEPDGTNPRLVAYPAGATSSTDVCEYTVTFPPSETTSSMPVLMLETINPPPDTTATGTAQAIVATYALAPMPSLFTPTVTLSVPQLDGAAGDNIWATSEFEVTLARASGADDECSLMSSQTVTFTVQADGTVTDDGSVPSTLTGTTATGAMCSYTVTFPAPPADNPGGDFDWEMAAPTQTQMTLTDTIRTATGTYTVGVVTFAPDATITVPPGNDGAAFSVDFASAQPNCSGSDGSPQTLTYTVPTGGTSAQPDTTNQSLIAYPQGATASTGVCVYTVTFPTNENGAATALMLETINPPPDATATGTAQAIAATYVPALKGVSSGESFSCALQSDGAVFCWGDDTHNQLAVPALTQGVTFTQVSTGRAHACALKSDDTVVCWGDNTNGQTAAPNPPSGVTFTSVDAGTNHSCGLKSDGNIECWGSDELGKSTDVPPLAVNERFEQVSAGGAHSCAVKSDESVVCWGENFLSQLVDRTPSTGSFVSVSVGVFVACGAKTDGNAQCWGNTNGGRGSPPAGPFASVSAGQLHVCGVKTDGTVACWGSNTESQRTVPAASFAAVSVGVQHSCGLTLDGAVACWGYGNFGQATSPSGTFAAVTGGQYHSCGIKTDDTTVCWGANSSQQGTVPTLGAGEWFTQVSAGALHTCGVQNDDTAACWGNNGAGSAAGRVSNVPSGATDLFTSVAAGGGHSCGVRSGGDTDGRIVCWGNNLEGQLDPPSLGAGEKFTVVDVGAEHSCALKSDMSVACWGFNGSRSGDGRVNDRPRGATDLFTQLSVGYEHACALRAADATVTCWGNNRHGQSTPPTGAFSAVAAGELHTCGIRSGGADDGTVVCWGSNAAGQADAPEGTFSALTAGRFHTCGIRSIGAADNTVVCWGAGTEWQRITGRLPS